MFRDNPSGVWSKVAVVAACALCCASAGAGVITFTNGAADPNSGSAANTSGVGSTAHVAVGYSAYTYFYGSGYGGLGGGTGAAIYSENTGFTEVITFVAIAGYLVTLDSFDLAQYSNSTDRVDISVTGGSTAYSRTNEQPAGGPGNFTHYTPGVTGTSLTFTITNLYNVGLNNITFSESLAPAAAVPEPASLALVGIGGLAWALARRRRGPAASACQSSAA